MLETFESDDDVSSLAASDAGPFQPYIQQTSCHEAPEPESLHDAIAGLSSTINMPREQPPDRIASAKHRLLSFLRAFSRFATGWARTSRWLPRRRSVAVKVNRG